MVNGILAFAPVGFPNPIPVFLLAISLTCTQLPAQPVSTDNQDKPPAWQALFENAIKQKQLARNQPIDRPSARELLVACYADDHSPDETRYFSQFFFNDSVWQTENVAALDIEDPLAGGERLRKNIADIESDLINQGVPKNVARIGRYFIANYYFQRNMPSEFAQALKEPEFVVAITSPEVFSVFRGSYLNLCGLLAASESNFSDAFEFHERALATRKALPWSIDTAESLNNLALLSLQMGDFVSAKNGLLEAIQIYSGGQDLKDRRPLMGEMVARLNLTNAIQYSEIPPAYHKAASGLQLLIDTVDRLIESAPAAEIHQWKLFRCICRNNLAINHFNTGQFDDCEKLMESVRTQRMELCSPTDIRLAEDEINLGWAKLETGQPEDSEQLFRSALKRLKTDHPDAHRIPEAMSYLARTLITSNPDEARSLLDEALDSRQRELFTTLKTSLSDRNRLAFLQNLRIHPESISWPGVFDTYLELAEKLQIPVEEQYRRVLIWKGALARVRLASSSASGDSIKQLESERASLRRKLFLATKCTTAAKGQMGLLDLSALESQANELERELRRQQPNQIDLPPAVVPADIRKMLPNDGALLDIVEFRQFLLREEGDEVFDERRYGAFVVKPDSVKWIDLGLREDIDEILIDFRETLQSKRNSKRVAGDLNEAFGANLRKQLGEIGTLLVSADGQFHNLAWSALADPQQTDKFWGDDLKIISLPSAQSLVSGKRAQAPTDNQWVTVGNVDYGQNEAGNQWDALKATGREAETIDGLLTQAFPTTRKQPRLDGAAATKAELLKQLGQKSIVHIATHGKFFGAVGQTDAFAVLDATSQLDSALVMAGVNTDPTCGFDSLLTAEEIGGMDLQHVRLLVLSACETGLGHVQAGQGVVGLTGAFEQAGVQSTIASLWKVDDNATQLLMTFFYKRLLENPKSFSVPDALQYAQQQLKQAEGGRYQSPYYWAPWVIVGRAN